MSTMLGASLLGLSSGSTVLGRFEKPDFRSMWRQTQKRHGATQALSNSG